MYMFENLFEVSWIVDDVSEAFIDWLKITVIPSLGRLII